MLDDDETNKPEARKKSAQVEDDDLVEETPGESPKNEKEKSNVLTSM